MLYLIGAGLAAALGWWAWKRYGPMFQRGEVRIAAGAASAVSLGAAAFTASRESWSKAIILLGLALWMAFLARTPRGGPRRERVAPQPKYEPSLEEARSILGVKADATHKEIQDAYVRLIRFAHPDAGGSEGLAQRINAARDVLLGR